MKYILSTLALTILLASCTGTGSEDSTPSHASGSTVIQTGWATSSGDHSLDTNISGSTATLPPLPKKNPAVGSGRIYDMNGNLLELPSESEQAAIYEELGKKVEYR